MLYIYIYDKERLYKIYIVKIDNLPMSFYITQFNFVFKVNWMVCPIEKFMQEELKSLQKIVTKIRLHAAVYSYKSITN